MKGNLIRHLQPKNLTDCSRAYVEFTAKVLLNQPTVKQVIKAQHESKAPLPLPTVAAIDERLVDWVVDGEMPLCVVERSSFLLLVYSLNDRYTVPSSYKTEKDHFCEDERVHSSTGETHQQPQVRDTHNRRVEFTTEVEFHRHHMPYDVEGRRHDEAALHCHYFRGSHNAKKYTQVCYPQ